MKRLFCLILCLVLSLSLAACGPALSGPTETAGNPFTQETTAAPEESTGAAGAPGTPAGDPTVPKGFVMPTSHGMGMRIDWEKLPGHNMPTYSPEFTEIVDYSGGEFQVPIVLSPDGYEYVGCGLVVFLDGIPQPYRLNEQEDYQYLIPLYLPDGDHELTISFMPVTGTEGKFAELWIAVVAGPEFVVRDSSLSGYASRAILMSNYVEIHFNVTPEAQTVPPTEDRKFTQTVSYEKLSYTESIALPEDRRRTQNVTSRTINGGNLSTIFNVSAETPVTVQLTVYGAPDVDYRLVFYYDNLPLNSQPMEVINFQDGEKAVIETTVDLTGFDGYARLSAYLVPLNARIQSDGTNVANMQIFCHCEVDAILTSAKDVNELYSGNS